MNKKLWATVAFVMVVGGVLITFTFLGNQGGPPPMAGGPHHRLRFDLNKDLIGVETDPVVDLLNLPPITDKKAVEKRVNTGCTQCHAKLPEHHPPKTECIKCHRMAPANAAGGSGAQSTTSTTAGPGQPPPTMPSQPGGAPTTPSSDAGQLTWDAGTSAAAAGASATAADAGTAP